MKIFLSKGVKSVLDQRTVFWVFDSNLNMEAMGKEINIWLIIILVWLFSSELCKVVRRWEKKKKASQQERWKQRKQGYTVIYFGKCHLPYNTKREGGVGEKFPERTDCEKRKSKGKEKGERTQSDLKNQSKLDIVKNYVPWPTQTLKEKRNALTKPNKNQKQTSKQKRQGKATGSGKEDQGKEKQRGVKVHWKYTEKWMARGIAV